MAIALMPPTGDELTMATDRHPPHNLEAEKSVLGAILLKPAILILVETELVTDDFFLPAHREIWDAMVAVSRRGMPIDVLMLADELKARGVLTRLDGGEGYLLRIANAVPTAENVEYYVKLVRDKAIKRKLIAYCAEAMSSCYGDGGDAEALVDEHMARLGKLVGATGDLNKFADLSDRLIEVLEKRSYTYSEGGGHVVQGVRFAVASLDDLTTGIHGSDLVIVAGQTGGGKTALAMQAAITNVLEGGSSIAFNLEMPALQLAERAIALNGQVDSHAMRMGNLGPDDWRRIVAAKDRLCGTDLYIEANTFTLRGIVAKLRRWRGRHSGVKAVAVVDFVQLIRALFVRGMNRARELGIYAQTLKQVAKDLDIAMIVVSQVNREGAKATGAPTMNDLKESGDLEQAADMVIIAHNPNTDPDKRDDGIIELHLGKNRNGPRGMVKARWQGRYYLFTDEGQAYDG